MKRSEVQAVSVGRLRGEFEEILRQREQSEQSFLQWRGSNLSLRPRASSGSVSTSIQHQWEEENIQHQWVQHKQEEDQVYTLEDYKEGGASEYVVSQDDPSEYTNSDEDSAPEYINNDEDSAPEYNSDEDPAGEIKTNRNTTDIKTGRVSVTELKNIFSTGKRVEVKLNH